jgi:hypothetical protein
VGARGRNRSGVNRDHGGRCGAVERQAGGEAKPCPDESAIVPRSAQECYPTSVVHQRL